MNTSQSITRTGFSVRFEHDLRFTRGVFTPEGAPGSSVLAELITSQRNQQDEHEPARVSVFVDSGVLDCWPNLLKQIKSYFQAHEGMALSGPIHPVPGGEVCKNDRSVLERICGAIHDAGLCRQSYVVAIGGGAVLDVVGFAAAVVHRGVRLIRLPTTTLAQADSGVGVKNGINAFGKKNFLGAFSVPWAVVNDEQFLDTLSDRDWRNGFSEAVKVALIKDRGFFNQIVQLTPRIVARDPDAADAIIRRSAQLHLRHIVESGDAFELGTARPLDFGHWSAHKLEQMTDFALRHGEAVAIGVALDVTYSALISLLPWTEAEVVLQCLADLGFSLQCEAMRDGDSLLAGLEEFRQHLGGKLSIHLLKGIGQPLVVHEIQKEQMLAAVKLLLNLASRPERISQTKRHATLVAR